MSVHVQEIETPLKQTFGLQFIKGFQIKQNHFPYLEAYEEQVAGFFFHDISHLINPVFIKLNKPHTESMHVCLFGGVYGPVN